MFLDHSLTHQWRRDAVTVVWGTVPCPDQRGVITEYRLRYSNGTSIVNTTGEGSRQHVLTGLTPFTSYSVQVAAVNAGGTGSSHCRMVSDVTAIGVYSLYACSSWSMQCLICQPVQEQYNLPSHGVFPQSPMDLLLCTRLATTQEKNSTHQPHSTH